MPVLSREKRKIYLRKISGLWEEFRNNRIGLAGWSILLFYLVFGAISPFLTPYRPDSRMYKPPKLASRFAMPNWMTVFPQYADLPSTIRTSFIDLELISEIGPVSVEWQSNGEPVFFFNASMADTAEIVLGITLDYAYVPPMDFRTTVYYTAEQVNNTRYKLEVIIKNTTNIDSWEEYLEDPTQAVVGYFSGSTPKGAGVGSESAASTSLFRRLFAWKYPNDPQKLYVLRSAPILFSQKSAYDLQFKISFESRRSDEGSTCKIQLNRERSGENSEFVIWGSVHGILGTNQFGYDVFTELIYGINISFLVGVLAAVIATSLGIMFGVLSGYLGGITDELIMRVVDVLLCLPVLPILLIMITFFTPSVYHVVILIAIFGWQGLSRVIRSKVLSIRELPFIESARAAGASDSYLMIRHLVPNIIPVAMAAMILAVPGAILTEAALSFLGFGDPDVATWGRMLYRAQNEGAFPALAWWYIIPPGIAITTLCMAFVFIGHALDEIVNPRLRRRR